jgi:hypothetical protein
METADTFDIILFRCSNGGGKIIRSYTNSHWDHAGMVIRVSAEDPADEILILEATSNSGVHLKIFSKMIKHIGDFY